MESKMKKSLIAILASACMTTPIWAAIEQTATFNQQENVTMQDISQQNKKAGEQFLAENKTKPGVVTLKDGLQYKILSEGTGPKPSAQDTVTVHYAGTLINGNEFDSSYKRGQPATFRVSGVIPGWVEALQLMPQGSTWELYIPADLAYGDNGAPPVIGPNEVLVFKVQLLKIN
jgi:FKBP-type peptidyl-prolyl cis-trans isomerase FklB